jgi:hypothetical protein
MNDVSAKLLIKPSVSKNDDFILSLADYFNKEFHKRGIESHKHESYVKIGLSNIYKDKYDSMIIDCVNGKLYLRGKGYDDKYFGKLGKCNFGRKSDAYYCCNYNIKKVIDRLQNIENELHEVRTVLSSYDDRKHIAYEILDLRDEDNGDNVDVNINNDDYYDIDNDNIDNVGSEICNDCIDVYIISDDLIDDDFINLNDILDLRNYYDNNNEEEIYVPLIIDLRDIDNNSIDNINEDYLDLRNDNNLCVSKLSKKVSTIMKMT